MSNIKGERRTATEDDGPGDMVLTPQSPNMTFPRAAMKGTKARRYDIHTLMDIGRRIGSSSESSDITANTLEVPTRSNRANSGSRTVAGKAIGHRRTSTNISLNNDDGSKMLQLGNIQYPRRQPINAPHGSLAQSDAGFARFLKEHSSPKHHRVTAGGRIVPMNLTSSPAPEFKLPLQTSERPEPTKQDKLRATNRSMRAVTYEEPEPMAKQQRQQDVHNERKGRNIDNESLTPPLLTPIATSDTVAGAGGVQHVSGSFYAPSSTTSGLLLPGQQHITVGLAANQGANLGQSVTDGGALYPNHSMFDKSGDNMGWIPPNIQQQYSQLQSQQMLPISTQLALQQMYAPLNTISPMGNPTPAMMGPQAYPFPILAPNLMSQGMQSGNILLPNVVPPQEQTGYKTLEDVVREHDMLADQLANLDRYLALHSWDIDPMTKKTFVEQRKDLVTKLDMARSSREQLESALQGQLGARGIANAPYLPQYGQANLSQNHLLQMSNIVNGQSTSYMPNYSQTGNSPFFTPNSTVYMQGSTGYSTNDQASQAMFQQPYSTSVNGMVPAGYEPWAAQIGLNGNDSYAQNWNIGSNVTGNANATENNTGTSSTNEIEAADNDGWKTPLGSAPAEVARIYRSIEEAAKRGDNIGPYVGELAKLTAKLYVNKPGQRNRVNAHSSIGYPSSSNRGHRKQNSVITNSSGGSMGYVSMPAVAAASGVVSSENKRSPFQERHVQQGFDSRAKIHTNDGSEAMKETAPYAAENHQINITASKPASCGTLQGSPCVPQSAHSLGTGARQDHLATPSRTSKVPDALDAPTLMPASADRGDLGKTTSKGLLCYNALSFIPWGRNEQKASAQKVDTSTAAQKINAHGYLPPFDGPVDLMDQDPLTEAATGEALGQNKSTTRASPKQATTRWFQRPARKEPRPMDVRAFFQNLREEEKELIRKTQKESRPFG